MKWRSIILPALIVIILGGLAGFVVFLYLSQYPALVASGEDAYNILRDVTMIVIAVLTLFMAVLIAIVGWALRGILLQDLKSEFGAIVEESCDSIFSSLHGKIAPLYGRLYEYDKSANYLIEYAIDEARKALFYAEKLDKEQYWELRLMATNNYLMALADRGDQGDANEAYKVSNSLERLIKEEEDIPTLSRWQETIYFARFRLPRINSDDRGKAIQDFYALKEHPAFKGWEKRWIECGLDTKDASRGKSS